jgi:RimJ/RimL family protein N-acetyltransferase
MHREITVDFREITDIDSESYYKLRVLSGQEYPEFVGFNPERELATGPQGIATLLSQYASEGTVIFGAFENNELVGVLALSRRLSPKYRHKAFLWGMYIIPQYRGSGVAQSLMQISIYWAINHPEIIALSLQVTLSNIRAQKLYERLGFTIFGTEQNSLFAGGQYHAAHYMELVTPNA